MDEVLLVTSDKEPEGIAVLDLKTTSTVCTNFKNCGCDSPAICSVGGPSSVSGQGYSGDYLVAAQAKKPQINVWQWGKPQEISTALACDPSGSFLMSGAKSGRMYWWDISSGELLRSFQGHFKSITTAQFTKCGMFVLTSSLDGMVRMWDVVEIVSSSAGLESGKRAGGANVAPYRSWSPHTLPITGLFLQGSGSVGSAPLRVMTCSLDRSIVLYDIAASHQCYRRSLPDAGECLVQSPLGDRACVGGSSGLIFLVDLTVTAHVLSSIGSGSIQRGSDFGKTFSTSFDGIHVLEGHSRRVTCLVFSMDNCVLVSGSEDGSIRLWDTWTKICTRELKPLNKNAITSLTILMKPPVVSGSELKMSFSPFGHLKKYKANEPRSSAALSDRIESSASTEHTSSQKNSAPASGTRFTGVLGRDVLGPKRCSGDAMEEYLFPYGEMSVKDVINSRKRVLENSEDIIPKQPLGGFIRLPSGVSGSNVNEKSSISMNTGTVNSKRNKKSKK